MPTEDDVRRLCLDLAGVTERPSWGRPAWFARTLMARIWEPGVLTVKTDEREALAGTDPEAFFWTPHHERSPNLVLVRLDRVAPDELAELLDESYRIAGPPGKTGRSGFSGRSADGGT
ncbi:MmcQ/YjbR family DNA-binding protein [Arthrobacter sp. Marseille-P9274]|uniref:MmcQ/YjbR family DNA-binding protein n=1 Tax=Arthrobacter sp. Marseille-P9274 TaxID=2866572 RepID=UPI0021C7A9C4|nr:MmcQ/YjbR family DNA-binding protein [Arthrobacter sp. Marseille-P9274]